MEKIMSENPALNYIKQEISLLQAGRYMPLSTALLIDAFGSMDAASEWLASQGCISTKDLRCDGTTRVMRNRNGAA